MRLRDILFLGAVCLLIIIPTIPGLTVRHDPLLQGAWVDNIDGVQVLHLQGTPYAMGYQQGTLLADQAIQNLRAILAFGNLFGHTQQELLDAWSLAKPFVPQEYIQEMQGLANATNVSFDQIAMAYMVPSFVHCSSFASWGNATVDGRLYYARSLDFPLFIRDPVSKRRLQDNAVVIIREPSDGYVSYDPSFAGMTGSLGGFNDHGVACDVLSCWSNNETHTGTPLIFRLRMILDHAANLSAALTIINENRTEGWNCILSDDTGGVAVEQTANVSYAGTWDDPVEATRPFWQIPNVVRRTNIFIDPATAATQRTTYNPRILPILSTLLGTSRLGWLGVPAYLPWRHYLALSDTIEKNQGKLDMNASMRILRQVYNGTADPVFHLFVTLHAYCTLHQWVACPQTGEILLSLAEGTTNSWARPLHHFTLQQLRDHTPSSIS